MEHLDDPEGMGAAIFFAVTTQGDDEVFLYPCFSVIFRQGFFFKNRVGGIISQTDNKGAPGIDDLVQEFVFCVAGSRADRSYSGAVGRFGGFSFHCRCRQ